MTTAAVCVIPARGGSRRIASKNKKLFHGKPIIQYSIETAFRSGLFTHGVYVSTDDIVIASISKKCGAQVLMRSPDMCEDNIGTQDVMRDALHWIGAKRSEYSFPDVACCLYATAPLVRASDLTSAMLIHSIRQCSFVVAVASDPLRDIGNFYIGNPSLFGQLPLYTDLTGLCVIPPERAIDINTMDDWNRAEAMYAALNEEQATA